MEVNKPVNKPWKQRYDGIFWAWRICEIFKYDLGIIKYEDMITNE